MSAARTTIDVYKRQVESDSFKRRVAASPDPEQAMKDFVARQPMGRLGRPEELAEAILFAASPDVTFMTGANICLLYTSRCV